MTNNLTPWIVLGVLVVVSLYWKGYLKLPTRAQPPAPPVTSSAPLVFQAGLPDLNRMTARELGLLLAQAARREAEAEVAGQIADDATKKLKATFSAPFSAGEPAPAPPATPGV